MSGWDAATAEWYAERYGEHATNRLGVDRLSWPAEACVVDIGCGTGAALRHVAGKVARGRLIGIDPVERMLEIALAATEDHEAAGRFEYRRGAAEGIPVGDDEADVVLAFDSMDHWTDRAKGLSEVHRILKHGGQFVVVKDGGVPGAEEATQSLVADVLEAGFTLLEEREVTAEGISFGLWRFGVVKRSQRPHPCEKKPRHR